MSLSAKLLIPFIILAQILGLYARYFHIALRTIKHTSPIFFGYAITAILSVLCSSILIQTFGFLGIGIGPIIFQVVFLIFLFWRTRVYIATLEKDSSNEKFHHEHRKEP